MRSQITKLTSSIGNLQQEKGKLPSQPIQNPQGQNSVGVLGPSEGTFEHCKAVTTLRSGKIVDKTIQTKEPTQDPQSETVRDDEVADKLMSLKQMLLRVNQRKTRLPMSL